MGFMTYFLFAALISLFGTKVQSHSLPIDVLKSNRVACEVLLLTFFGYQMVRILAE